MVWPICRQPGCGAPQALPAAAVRAAPRTSPAAAVTLCQQSAPTYSCSVACGGARFWTTSCSLMTAAARSSRSVTPGRRSGALSKAKIIVRFQRQLFLRGLVVWCCTHSPLSYSISYHGFMIECHAPKPTVQVQPLSPVAHDNRPHTLRSSQLWCVPAQAGMAGRGTRHAGSCSHAGRGSSRGGSSSSGPRGAKSWHHG